MVNDKPQDIRERAYKYALRAIKLFQHLKENKDEAARIIGKQYLRSATSIGANLEEAHAGESGADFAHKNGIARKEARESLYWLRLLEESHLVPNARLRDLIAETDEIAAILTTITRKAKRKSR